MSTQAVTDVPVVKPGLHKGIPYDEYARWDAVNHSVLRHFNRTAMHAREALIRPADQTDAQFLGQAGHVAVLEPERFVAEYVPAPKFDKRTKEGKQGWADFQIEHADKTCIPAEEHEACLRMRDAVWAHPTASELLKGTGLNEVSALWEDPGTGLRCKARIDRLTSLAGWPVDLELKTSRNAARSSFSRDLHSFFYHQQIAMQLDGLNTLAPHERKGVFVVMEKERPFAVAVYEIEEDALTLGRDEYQAHLAQFAECVKTNRWAGYPDGIDYISLPPWAFRAVAE